ncbi:MAG: hypothetical protein B6245_18735 [Desulfobacteraceae bacterium 4572_88]|nr:MAG: hypothetical protein B6245_18735 [Desulfobacteraceae bacterium 4572_88]
MPHFAEKAIRSVGSIHILTRAFQKFLKRKTKLERVILNLVLVPHSNGHDGSVRQKTCEVFRTSQVSPVRIIAIGY